MRKLNSFVFKDDVIEKMKETIIKTKKDKLERIFDFCNPGNNVLFYMNECTGKQCEVMPKRFCPVGDRFEGTFHTHAVPFSEQPSTGDLFNIMREGMGCIGSAKNEKAKCYFFESSKGYNHYIKVYEKVEKIDKIEEEITKGAPEKPELWPELAKKLEKFKEKNDIIRDYFKPMRIL